MSTATVLYHFYKSADYMLYCFEDENVEELATSFRLDIMHIRLGMSQRTGYRRVRLTDAAGTPGECSAALTRRYENNWP